MFNFHSEPSIPVAVPNKKAQQPAPPKVEKKQDQPQTETKPQPPQEKKQDQPQTETKPQPPQEKRQTQSKPKTQEPVIPKRDTSEERAAQIKASIENKKAAIGFLNGNKAAEQIIRDDISTLEAELLKLEEAKLKRDAEQAAKKAEEEAALQKAKAEKAAREAEKAAFEAAEAKKAKDLQIKMSCDKIVELIKDSSDKKALLEKLAKILVDDASKSKDSLGHYFVQSVEAILKKS